MKHFFTFYPRNLFGASLALLFLGLPLLVTAQKVVTLENYVVSPHSSSSKVGNDLIQMAEQSMTNARRASTNKSYDYPDELKTQGEYILIEAAAKKGKGAKLLAKLRKEVGLKDGIVYKHIVSGKIPAANVEKLESVSGLQFARPAYRPQTRVGAVTSRGDIVMKSDEARQDFGVDGSGQKIGFLSDSYNALGGAVDGVISGDLPAGVEILDDLTEGSDEGRAMAEIIHDIAPGADLAFHTAFGGQAVFAQGIIDLADAGCNVIVDDVGYFAEPFFQDGIISQAVDIVSKRDVTYLSSAGNGAQDSYEKEFNNLGFQLADTAGNILGFPHDFGNGDIFQRYTVPPGGDLILSLQWPDPYFSASGQKGAETDLDLFLLFPQFNASFSSTDNNIGGDPIEVTGVINTSDTNTLIVDVLITKVAGPDPDFIKYINFGDFFEIQEFAEDTQAPTVYGHSNANRGIAVGATAWFNVPEFNSNLSLPRINGFSSKGGIPILFNRGGDAIDPVIRKKPEFVGPDGVNTTFFARDLSFPVPGTDEPDGFPNFFGTSASAPHVAAVVALINQQSNNTLKPRRIEDIIASTAIDMDDPTTEGFDEGFDFKTGTGFVDVVKAMEKVAKQDIPMAAVRPVLETVAYDQKAGNYRALFGYLSENSVPVLIPTGENNKLVPGDDLGQPEEFLPGRQAAVFEIELDAGETVVWSLKGPDGKRRTATATAPEGEVTTRFDNASRQPESSLLGDNASDILPGTYVYPNPTSGRVFLEVIDAPETPIQVNVLNALGQSVYQTGGNALIRETVDLRPFGQGLYIVQSKAGAKLTTRKIIVE
ncbi:T9SS type A sorting domain-containing protein [Tunicatimonas pelagia]|uniref:T9SS type A sorting domain-containing protein n=1 Tax=Tunicatimonas pelagia TaxID=931531 RepID=UPI0026660616|nr:T9SS type A sorting domain-containing protein [Tunicatimonas pelagia]WKN42041.1 T9SS type A sorting domain-containing protein [Tunicatimonas pelagia]